VPFPAFARTGAASAVVFITAGCGLVSGTAHSSASAAPSSPSSASLPRQASPQTRTVTGAASSSATSRTPKTASLPPSPTRHRAPAVTRVTTPTRAIPSTTTPAGGANRPLIVIDPGHSVTVAKIDPVTGLNVSDYENEPEMRDVWDVAVLVKRRLRAAGYRVAMTKANLDQPASLAARARLANRLHARLALSIHDQAGPNGGIGFNEGNNIVYYQSVGTYRATSSGHRVYFTNRAVALKSRTYGYIFKREREAYEGHYVSVRENVGYNLGARGLAPGNIWMVQLLSHVPWIYNEVGGNSTGRIGLSAHDNISYAEGLVESVEHCLPVPGR
jgi:N-acetylmuramoyl-L-alanine amidase